MRAVLYGASALGTLLALASYDPFDPSLNAAASLGQPGNLMGRVGSYSADLLFQIFGLTAFLVPVVLGYLCIKHLRGLQLGSPRLRAAGLAMLSTAAMSALALLPVIATRVGGRVAPLLGWEFRSAIPLGGFLGRLIAGGLLHLLNLTGTVVVLSLAFIASFYLLTMVSMGEATDWMMERFGRPWQRMKSMFARAPKAPKPAKADEVEVQNRIGRKLAEEARAEAPAKRSGLFPVITVRVRGPRGVTVDHEDEPQQEEIDAISRMEMEDPAAPPIVVPPLAPVETFSEAIDELPAVSAEDHAPWDDEPALAPPPAPESSVQLPAALTPAPREIRVTEPAPAPPPMKPRVLAKSPVYRMPSTGFLREPDHREALDEEELKSLAQALKMKFAEFGVMGTVTQINPGPVVTTFEFKPEAGIKYSRITNLVEDLCLAMEAESILIERIPGKSTIGIEVPNAHRETIYLREMMESREFSESTSKLTLALGKDINGRLRVAELNTMPHLLMAGSTGTGKSVCLNSFLVSMLYKATPDDVRLILVDPKRLELGLYDGIPHLLVPIITEPKLAATALKNAVKEMERRLRVLAEKGVRNIEQYNRALDKPRTLNLFAEDGTPAGAKEQEQKLPQIVIIIDELADLMMVDSSNVETSITRLAQMARAVGIHLILATQRPSVDVITGLIKANFPARISFRVATKVDSRTILDANGAESLLGRGDALYLPSGSGRLLRVHGPLVTEDEINKVVEFWRSQSKPNYETQYLAPPPREDSDEDSEAGDDLYSGEQDPMYEEAVRVVVEAGKASTSTLQRRLRLGYGRAARMLDIMEHDGIIGPPDGSKPREVLKRPDWLAEVDSQLR